VRRRWAALLAAGLLVSPAAGCAAGEPEADHALRQAQGSPVGGEAPAPTSPEEAAQRPSRRAGSSEPPAGPAEEPGRELRVQVVAKYPHDTEAFTQGLLLDPDDPGTLLESTGNYGRSELRRVDLASGEPMRRVELPDELFGEGLALVPGSDGEGDLLVQLTWREGVALLWDAATLERRGERAYSGEGWGLCYDAAGGRLVRSDGSPRLAFHDPGTFAETGGVDVTWRGRRAGGLNELECVGGRVWANLYGLDRLAEIDLSSGRVTALVDAAGLLTPADAARADVMNGIAHDPADDTFLLTGKWWPQVFRVRFVAAE
jgi:glutamine cyclotransferase